jgi:aryl-alcohol dehydrogenase-like predicted oxidoreductase
MGSFVQLPLTLAPAPSRRRQGLSTSREGKIRAIGVSNFSPAQMDRFRKGAPLTTIQPPYNLFEREIENDVLPYAPRNRLVVLAYGVLCRGLLTGKITAKTEFQDDDLRKIDPKFQKPRLGHYLAAVDRLDAFARERYGKTVLALAVRWLLDRGKIVVLWGAAGRINSHRSRK